MLCRWILLLPLLLGGVSASDEKVDAEQASDPQSTNLSDVTFHVVALPHTVVRDDFSACAFTMKVKRMCSMLESLGLRSVLYANEGSMSDCDKMEVILSDEERQRIVGHDSQWKSGGFFNSGNEEAGSIFNEKAIEAISRNKNRKGINFLLAMWGVGHQTISSETGLTTIEPGIGYPAAFARYRVYESYSWMHVKNGDEQVNNYHAVIPNCYYVSEFEGASRPKSINGRYLAFVGRIVQDKGFLVVLEILKSLPEDYTLHVAGQGKHILSMFVPDDHPLHDRVFYYGVLAPKERNDLIFGAEALIAPTLYREPFGGVMVEAQMLGTPVVTTDHAAFSETIWHGVTGYRCRTLRCFVAAAKEAHTLDRTVIARRAIETYDCNRIQYQHEDYFQDVLNIFDPEGWYKLNDGPGHTLEQRKFYPSSGAVDTRDTRDAEDKENEESCKAVFKVGVYAWLKDWVEAITGRIMGI
mmetsp:Transcript_2946/g.6821  ORF Transcript_2946/g.6821 Transcript_2946/m.6821 type:complete len:469 (-) Transcript_2946:98-1504(-)